MFWTVILQSVTIKLVFEALSILCWEAFLDKESCIILQLADSIRNSFPLERVKLIKESSVFKMPFKSLSISAKRIALCLLYGSHTWRWSKIYCNSLELLEKATRCYTYHHSGQLSHGFFAYERQNYRVCTHLLD